VISYRDLGITGLRLPRGACDCRTHSFSRFGALSCQRARKVTLMYHLVPAATRISLTTMSQFRPHETTVILRIRKKAAMVTPAIGKKSLRPKALRNRIKYSDSWSSPLIPVCPVRIDRRGVINDSNPVSI
jgi:hypothetical protein